MLSPLDQAREMIASGATRDEVLAALRARGFGTETLAIVAEHVPELAEGSVSNDATPYGRALALAGRGATDEEILATLLQHGSSAEDAVFVLRSLPGREYGDTRAAPEERDVGELGMSASVAAASQLTGVPLDTLWDALNLFRG